MGPFFSLQGHFQPCVFFLRHTHTSTTSFLSPNHPRGQSGPHVTLCTFKYPYIFGHCCPCWRCPSQFVPQSCYSFFRHHPSGHLTFRVISVSSRQFHKVIWTHQSCFVVYWPYECPWWSPLLLYGRAEYDSSTDSPLPFCASREEWWMARWPQKGLWYLWDDSVQSDPYKYHTILNFHKL